MSGQSETIIERPPRSIVHARSQVCIFTVVELSQPGVSLSITHLQPMGIGVRSTGSTDTQVDQILDVGGADTEGEVAMLVEGDEAVSGTLSRPVLEERPFFGGKDLEAAEDIPLSPTTKRSASIEGLSTYAFSGWHRRLP